MLTAEFPGRNPGFCLAENTDDLFVGKSLLHGDVLMWLMKTLLTSRCVNQRGAGHIQPKNLRPLPPSFSACAIPATEYLLPQIYCHKAVCRLKS